MSDDAPKISYEERHDPGFLERLLLDRKPGVLNAVFFLCAVTAIALAVFHLYVAAFGTPEGRSFRSVHLTGMLVLAIFMNPLFRASSWQPISVPGDPRNGLRWLGFSIDLALIALVLFVEVWTLYDIDAFHMRYGEKELPDIIVGGMFIVLVLEATRRAVGWAMVIITGFFISHALYANYFFGFFYGPPVRFQKFIDTLFMSSDGIFGIPLHVCATYIVLFIIFGALLIRSGAGKFFIDLAVSLTGHRTGGPAKASAVASGFMGMVSGSAVANVVTTGSFTIPLMRNIGYRPRFAAAVEACASSGGQITPPIMGAAAFIMAEFLETSYINVVIAAVIPAFLYFVTIYFMVHLEAEKHDIGRIDKKFLPQTFEVLRRGWHLLIALGVLIYFLIAGYTPMLSAFWGIAALFALSFINRETRLSPVDVLAALEAGIRATVPVTIACACAGLIIGSVFVSGLGLKFTQQVIDLAGGNLLVLLSLTGVSAIILGMGITTTAVYITVAALIVPALIKTGIRGRRDRKDRPDGDRGRIDPGRNREVPRSFRLRLQSSAAARRAHVVLDRFDPARRRRPLGAVDGARRLVSWAPQRGAANRGARRRGRHPASALCDHRRTARLHLERRGLRRCRRPARSAASATGTGAERRCRPA
jgi:TRAP transporter 4TM/12TM fusion protein